MRHELRRFLGHGITRVIAAVVALVVSLVVVLRVANAVDDLPRPGLWKAIYSIEHAGKTKTRPPQTSCKTPADIQRWGHVPELPDASCVNRQLQSTPGGEIERFQCGDYAFEAQTSIRVRTPDRYAGSLTFTTSRNNKVLSSSVTTFDAERIGDCKS